MRSKNNTNEDRELVTKEEMNLAEYPIQYLNKIVPENVKTVEWSGETVTGDGKKHEARWIVTGSDKYGLTRYHDRDVLLGLMYYWKQSGFNSPEILIENVADFLRLLKWPDSGNRYKDLRESLDRLAGITIIADWCFWDNTIKDYLPHIVLHIFDEVSFEKKGRSYLLRVKSSKRFWESVRDNYIKSLDLNFYLSLDTPSAKALYSYLDKKSYTSNEFVIEVIKLAKHLGISIKQPIRQIRRVIKEASEILVSKGFLRSFAYIKNNNKELIRFIFNKNFKEEISGEEGARVSYLVDEMALVLGERSSFLEKVAMKVPIDLIFRVLSEVKEMINLGELKGKKMEEFKKLIKKYMKEMFNEKI